MSLGLKNREFHCITCLSTDRVRMMTMKLDLKNWVKIDKTYASQQREKERLKEIYRDEVFVTNADESTKLAKRELLETLVKYLPGKS